LLQTAWRVTRATRLLEVAWLGALLAVYLWLVPSSIKAAWRGAVTHASMFWAVAVLVSFEALYLVGLAVLRRCVCEHAVVPVTACGGCRRELWWSGAPSALRVLVGPVALDVLLAVLPARWERWCVTCVSPELASHVLAGIAAGLCCVALVAWRREGRRPVFQLLQRDERRVVLRGPVWWRDALGGRVWTAPARVRSRPWTWLTAVPWLR